MAIDLLGRIEEWRRKLLDLTIRNQLVSCKIGPRAAIRLEPPSPGQVWSGLLGGADVTCSVYGVEVVKTVKTFLATHATFGGVIRVVIVKEPTGPQFFYYTDADVREILEAFGEPLDHRTGLPRRQRGLGERSTTGPQPVDEHRRLSPEPMAVHADGTLDLDAQRGATDAPHRLAVGHVRPPSVPRGSPQSSANAERSVCCTIFRTPPTTPRSPRKSDPSCNDCSDSPCRIPD